MMPRFAQTARIRVRRFLRTVALLRHWLFAIYLWITVGAARRKAGKGSVGEPSRIAIIRLDDVGDFVLTTPFLRAIRKRFPGAHISLIVKSQIVALAEGCPYVDEVIPFHAVRVPPPLDQLRTIIRARRFARLVLAPRKLDYAVMPRVDTDDAGALSMAYFARIPVRVGYSTRVLPHKRIKNLGYDRFLTCAIETLTGSHEVEWSLHTASMLGVANARTDLELWPSATADAMSERIMGNLNAGEPRVVIGIAPGANLDRRRWPIERFAVLVGLLVREFGAQVVVIGGKEDVELGEQMVSFAGALGDIRNLAGTLTWPETAAVLKRCNLFIGNDSGPLHVAAAMRTACVAISCHPRDGDPLGANSPARFGPWGVPSAVIRPESGIAPCSGGCVMPHAHCIRAVSVLDVMSGVRELLGPSIGSKPSPISAAR